MCKLDNPASNGRVVSLGYLMLLLNLSMIPEVIPPDEGRALSIAQEILPILQAKIRTDLLSIDLPFESSRFGSLNHHEQFIFGVMCLYGIGVEVDRNKAFQLIYLSANQGFARAQCYLGICYEKGIGVPVYKAEAIRWYSLSANQELARAQCYLGLCYEKGRGVPVNEAEAIRWYSLSANQGLAVAQCYLGNCYELAASHGRYEESECLAREREVRWEG
jgi:hypothetical protein